MAALRPRIVTIHCRNVGPDLGDSYWGRRDRGRAPFGEQSGPDFYTSFDLAQIKVWSLFCDAALMPQASLWRHHPTNRLTSFGFWLAKALGIHDPSDTACHGSSSQPPTKNSGRLKSPAARSDLPRAKSQPRGEITSTT